MQVQTELDDQTEVWAVTRMAAAARRIRLIQAKRGPYHFFLTVPRLSCEGEQAQKRGKTAAGYRSVSTMTWRGYFAASGWKCFVLHTSSGCGRNAPRQRRLSPQFCQPAHPRALPMLRSCSRLQAPRLLALARWKSASSSLSRGVRGLSSNVGKNYGVLYSKDTFTSSEDYPQLQFSTGVVGHLADASVLTRQGSTVVHAAIVSARADASEARDFFPLTVDYREKAYGSGVIPDFSNRKERHGTDEEILAARAVDRAIRPLFHPGFMDDVQVSITAHSTDADNDPRVVAVNAASCALQLSGLPWSGPLGCVRVAVVEPELAQPPSTTEADAGSAAAALASPRIVINPSQTDMEASILDLMYAGTESRTLMIEAEGKEVDENTMKAALKAAQDAVKDIITAQKELAADVGAKKFKFVDASAPPSEMLQFAKDFAEHRGKEVFGGAFTPLERSAAEGALRHSLIDALKERFPEASGATFARVSDSVMKHCARQAILAGKRADGRSATALRNLAAHVDVLPSVHGSAFFQRGETAVLCTATLAAKSQRKTVDKFGIEREHGHQHFFLHYDFPSYSTNELSKSSGPNRRMIGHGALAEKAVRGVLPDPMDFPYVIRVTSEVTSSNGSSSMATACGASLSLMDAGVPIKAPVAGVSVGLVTAEDDPNNHLLLTDILGMEDHYGDMDFKVAGTMAGITAIQLDTKLQDGIPLEILLSAIDRAKVARHHILSVMNSALAAPRPQLKDHTPRVEVVRYSPDRKRQLVGPQGEVIRAIETLYKCDVDLDEEGVAYIFSSDPNCARDAKQLIAELVADIEAGDVYNATVLEVKDFGAIVEVLRGQEAVLHMSELTHSKELLAKGVSKLLAPGQRVPVKVLAVDRERGQIKVSRRALLSADEPDQLEAEKIETEEAAFPTKPLVPWNKAYYTANVATSKKKAQTGEAATSEAAEAGTAAAPAASTVSGEDGDFAVFQPSASATEESTAAAIAGDGAAATPLLKQAQQQQRKSSQQRPARQQQQGSASSSHKESRRSEGKQQQQQRSGSRPTKKSQSQAGSSSSSSTPAASTINATPLTASTTAATNTLLEIMDELGLQNKPARARRSKLRSSSPSSSEAAVAKEESETPVAAQLSEQAIEAPQPDFQSKPAPPVFDRDARAALAAYLSDVRSSLNKGDSGSSDER